MNIVVGNEEFSSYPPLPRRLEVGEDCRPDDVRGRLFDFALAASGRPDDLAAKRITARHDGDDRAADRVLPMAFDGSSGLLLDGSDGEDKRQISIEQHLL